MPHSEGRRKRFTKWRIDLAIHDALAVARQRRCDNPFQQLLAVVISRSNMLRPQPPSGRVGWTDCERILRGLLSLSAHRKNWLRHVDDWIPTEEDLHHQFGSLACHLLATHTMPGFMTNVWFEGSSEIACKHQKLFKHLGLGNSIRGADLPLSFTGQMAEFFAQAPDHLSVEEALRWSQVRGMGGCKQFAAEVLATRLVTVFEDEGYWARVLQFLIERPRLERSLIAPIIDYIHVNRHRMFPQQFHQMTDQSFAVLLARVRQWMQRNSHYGRRPHLSWNKVGIGGFRFIEPQKSDWSMRQWSIQELTDSQQLIDEGNSLHHCVATYADECARQTSSIWSLKCHGSLESHQMLTIEVDPKDRTIVTALGNCNSAPKPAARRIMGMWAEQEELKIARWV